MVDLVFQVISGVAAAVLLFTFVFFFICISYHLMFDEDDPVKLRLELESFDKEWKELCSKL